MSIVVKYQCTIMTFTQGFGDIAIAVCNVTIAGSYINDVWLWE